MRSDMHVRPQIQVPAHLSRDRIGRCDGPRHFARQIEAASRLAPLEAHRRHAEARDRFGAHATPNRWSTAAQVHPSCATAVGCIDGWVASLANTYLRREFGIRSLYPVRCPAPLALLAGRGDPEAARWVREQVRRSSNRSASRLIAVVAHAGCSRSPGAPDEQIEDLCESVERVAGWGLGVEAVGLWVDETGDVEWLA